VKKLRSKRGETLLEALASILIAVLAFSLLATAAVSAEKINAKTRGTDVSFHYEAGNSRGTKSVKLKGKAYNQSAKNGDVVLYGNNGYYYYEYGASKGGAS